MTTKKTQIIAFMQGRNFQNVRTALKAFTAETGTTVSYIRFYNVIKEAALTAETLTNKKALVKSFVGTSEIVNISEQHKLYNASSQMPVSYLYFLNVVRGRKIANFEGKTAREIIAMTKEITSLEIAINLKNKAGIVKYASKILTGSGYTVVA